MKTRMRGFFKVREVWSMYVNNIRPPKASEGVSFSGFIGSCCKNRTDRLQVRVCWVPKLIIIIQTTIKIPLSLAVCPRAESCLHL